MGQGPATTLSNTPQSADVAPVSIQIQIQIQRSAACGERMFYEQYNTTAAERLREQSARRLFSLRDLCLQCARENSTPTAALRRESGVVPRILVHVHEMSLRSKDARCWPRGALVPNATSKPIARRSARGSLAHPAVSPCPAVPSLRRRRR